MPSKVAIERENGRLKSRLAESKRVVSRRDESIVSMKAWISRSGRLLIELREEVVRMSNELEKKDKDAK